MLYKNDKFKILAPTLIKALNLPGGPDYVSHI